MKEVKINLMAAAGYLFLTQMLMTSDGSINSLIGIWKTGSVKDVLSEPIYQPHNFWYKSDWNFKFWTNEKILSTRICTAPLAQLIQYIKASMKRSLNTPN